MDLPEGFEFTSRPDLARDLFVVELGVTLTARRSVSMDSIASQSGDTVMEFTHTTLAREFNKSLQNVALDWQIFARDNNF